ncbi:MAG: hypothetical protein HQK96_19235 [Nitrospirae bacterium]|nr:hypothetical protein [Nitrospirota bacterium]
MFDLVIRNPNTRTPLKVDVYLYMGMAMERLGISGRSLFENAYELNPYSKRTVQYIIMSDISKLKRLQSVSGSNQEKKEIIEGIELTVSKHKELFPVNDEWLEKVADVLK